MVDLLAQVDITLPTLLVLVLFAFLPPLVFVVWFRNTERYNREPWRQVLRAFGWGAVIGVVVGVILSLILSFFILEAGVLLFRHFYTGVAEALEARVDLPTLLLLVLVAPLAEEAAKGLGVFRVKRHINEMEDGIIYGATAGLGFGATENLLYGAIAFLAAEAEAPGTGLPVSLAVIGLRSVSSALLHASASSAFGYGVARSLLLGKSLLPLYLLAVFMHGAFNFFAGMGVFFVQEVGETAQLLGLGAAVLFALLAVGLARSAISREERRLRPDVGR